MSDQAHQSTHDLVDPDTESGQETEQDAVPSSTRYTGRGPIPAPLTGFQSPAPTASERAFGTAGQLTLRKGAQRKRTSPTNERVEDLIAILNRHARVVTTRLNDGSAGSMDIGELKAMKASLEEERSSLLAALANVPTGSALMMKAFAASDRISVVITRLDQLATTHSQKEERAGELASGEQAELSQAAAEKVPDGYCDTAPQQVPPCHLTEGKREKYRQHLRKVTGIAARNWTAAIQKAQVDEKFRQNVVTFEQQLGQILLGLLFDVVGMVGKAGAKKGLDKLDQALGTSYRIEGETIVKGGLDPAAKKVAHATADHVIPSVASGAQPMIKDAISAQQLAANAAKAAQVPADLESFLASIKDAPTRWELSIHKGVVHLLDADLEALTVAIPDDSPRLVPTYFEGRINDLLTRFQQQVMPINLAPLSECRPVQVITGHGSVRVALVHAEKAMDNKQRGEWRDVPVKTGKFSFWRWIDDDMKDIAVARAIEQDVTAGAFMRTATDASFWDEKSLKRLAQETSKSASVAPEQPENQKGAS